MKDINRPTHLRQATLMVRPKLTPLEPPLEFEHSGARNPASLTMIRYVDTFTKEPMLSITLNELSADSANFFRHLPAGEPCAVTDSGRTLALVIGMDAPKAASRQAGCYAGRITIAPDFNEPLPDWDEALNRAVF